MKFLKITNKGELDIRLVALMGGTTKSSNEYKIGQFGTGLKYTLAFLFRNNLAFKIFSGENNIKIHLEYETIHDEKFEIICINNNRTSITTRMGLEWNAWMIIRELWCNALDEGGYSKEIIETNNLDALTGNKNETSFYIQINNDIQAVLDSWNQYFIHDREAIQKGETYSIYPGTGSLRIYKQGVLIYHDKEKKSLFNYDIKNASINELRQFTGTVSQVCTYALSEADHKAAKYFLENVKEEHYEGSKLDYSWFKDFGDQWKEVIGDAKLIHTEAVKTLRARGQEVDLANKIVVPETVYKALTKQFDGIGALRVSQKLNEIYEIYDEEMINKTNQVLAILETCNYFVSPELKFVYCVFGDKSTLASVDTDEKIIYISEAMKTKSLFAYAAMLIEENEHFNTGMTDCTRNFQQHWIDLYVKTLFDKNGIKL